MSQENLKKLLAILILATASVVSSAQKTGQQEQNGNNNSSTFHTLVQLTEKFINKLNLHLPVKGPKARGYEGMGYGMDGFANELYGKSDYSWIVPLVVVVGFGTLLIPLMGTLMTTMITQGTINLTAGRRKKRHSPVDEFLKSPYLENMKTVMKNVQEAIAKFSKQFAHK